MQKKAIYGLILASMISGAAVAGGPDMAPPTPWHPFVGVNYSYLKADVSTTGVSYYEDGTVLSPTAVPFTARGGIPRVADKYNGIGMLAGLKYGKYVAFVWGWNHYFVKSAKTAGQNISFQPDPTGAPGVTITDQTGAETCTQPENFYFDVRGYVPFDNFDLIASVGANIADFSTHVMYTNGRPDTYHNITNVNFRAGVGADYYFTPNWGIEAMWNWVFQHASSKVGGAYGSFSQTNTLVGIPCSFWTLNVGINYMFN